MFARDLRDYLTALDRSTAKGEADKVREAFSQTDAMKACQLILGNFWNNDLVIAHTPAIVSVLTERDWYGTFFVNRFALACQLLNSPHICPTQRRDLNHFIEMRQKDIKTSWETLFGKVKRDTRFDNWFKQMQDGCSLRDAMGTFLIHGLHDNKLNTAAYLLMSKIEPLNYNFQGFVKNPRVVEITEQTLIRLSETPNMSSAGCEIIFWYAPHLKEKTIHRHGAKCGTKGCSSCQMS